MSALTPGHLLILLLVVVVLFGAKKLPDVARGLGQSARILKAEMRGMEDDSRSERTDRADRSAPRTEMPPASHAPDPTTSRRPEDSEGGS